MESGHPRFATALLLTRQASKDTKGAAASKPQRSNGVDRGRPGARARRLRSDTAQHSTSERTTGAERPLPAVAQPVGQAVITHAVTRGTNRQACPVPATPGGALAGGPLPGGPLPGALPGGALPVEPPPPSHCPFRQTRVSWQP
jgi:hypothetical protein